jgi:hypothetical protein
LLFFLQLLHQHGSLTFVSLSRTYYRKTVFQQTPIKPIDQNKKRTINVALGSDYAKDLGLGAMEEYDPATEKLPDKLSVADGSKDADNTDGDKTTGGKKNNKKKSNKKKKKK